MQNQKLTLKFTGATTSQANKYAQTLQDELRQIEDVAVDRQRDIDESQDFGATLILVLGTTSITAIARGLSKWLARNSGAKVEITTADGRVISADHLESSDAAAIAKLISSKQ